MIANLGFALAGAWKVLLAGMILGAGVPTFFALGIRALAWGTEGAGEALAARPRPVGRVLAVLCFAVVLFAVVAGFAIIMAAGLGKAVSFEHVFPVLVAKH
ncbi:MAG: hypothetical protein FWF90_10670 [Promicromonosporaceae bacterium]|nr:hypothetical protein [Promicromonosporaceae bacterium]